MSNKLNNICLAFDTSNNLGTVCLFNNQEIIFSEQIDEKYQHASKLALIIKKATAKVDNKIDYLSVGTGPGSFIGIRVAMATAMGYSFAKNIPIIGFDSHLALLLSHKLANKYSYVLTKAYGEIFYLSSFAGHKELELKKSIKFDKFLNESNKEFSLITDFSDEKLMGNFKNIIICAGPSPAGLRAAAMLSAECKKSFSPNYLIQPNVSVKSKSVK